MSHHRETSAGTRFVEKVRRYYSGVAQGRPTICCSAIALTIASALVIAVNDPVVTPPATVFPAQLVWSLPLNSELTAPPAFDGTRGFFAIDGDRLVAYDLTSGTQLWMIIAAVRHAPAVGNGLVFTLESSSIVARRQQDAAELWRTALAEAPSAPLTWANGWLVAGTVSGTVLALRAADGGAIWQVGLEAPLRAPAAIGPDRVYLPLADGHVRALQLTDGKVSWARRLGDVPNEITALDRRLFVGSNDNHLYALDAESGEVAWRWPTGADVIGRPVVADGRVLFVSLDNNLRALDQGSGAQRWMRLLPLRPTRGPTLGGEAVFVSGVSRTVHAYRIGDGQPLSDLTAPAQVASAPAFIGAGVLLRPFLIVATRDIATGATVAAYGRSLEPPTVPLSTASDLIAKMPGGKLTKP